LPSARLRIDPYILCLLGSVALASLLPARGAGAAGFGVATTVAIGLLFFLYGARLSTREALDGLRLWRLHSVVVAATFLLFPLLGLAARLLVPEVLSPELYAGLMFLCCLPSTVQSSIAFTSVARGNLAAAICAASFSNLIGILVTPLLVALLLGTKGGGGVSFAALRDITLQLLVPFVAGQLTRRWVGAFVARHKKVLGLVDKGSILLVVYAAFSGGVVAGIWHRLAPASLLLLGTNVLLLATVITTTIVVARRLGFGRADEITIVFCGSKKSLANGIPMATVLFPAPVVGLTVLPLMLFHQIQLMACAWLARRYADRAAPDDTAAPPPDDTAPPPLDGDAGADTRPLRPVAVAARPARRIGRLECHDTPGPARCGPANHH
jgi:sodium/bile acid cotransporter 7